MKRTLLLTMALILAPMANAAGEVVYVNIDRVYQESEITKAVLESIQGTFQERETALRQQSEEIRKLSEALEKEALTLSNEDLEKQRTEIEQKERNFLRDRRALVEDSGLLFEEKKRVVDLAIAEVIEAIAIEREYAIVLNPFVSFPVENRAHRQNNFFYADKSADITADVIARFDGENDAASFK